jgi:P22 coat protein - gene protein 5
MTTYPNTLTGLIPTLYKAADTVARELVGFIPAVFKNSDVEEVALNQLITYPIVGTQTPAAIVPGPTGPDAGGQTVTTGTMLMDKQYSTTFPWNGDEQKSIAAVYDQTLEAQFAQSMRALCNLIETDLFLAAKRTASRAYGAAGTTPFPTAGVFTDFAELVRILDDNGAPSDRHLVLNTTAATKILSVQSSLFKANEAGSDSMLRTGNLGTVEGLMLHKSPQIVTHVKGTGTSYVVNGSHAVGATTLVAKTGSGTVLYGDVIALEDDSTHKYVVNTGIAAPGSMVIGGPGLRQAQTDGKTITVGENYLGSWAFDRSAIHLLTRLPAMPAGGDSADDSVTITDPLSGLSFQVNLYRQYHQVTYEVGIAWGVKAVKSDFIATLLG